MLYCGHFNKGIWEDNDKPEEEYAQVDCSYLRKAHATHSLLEALTHNETFQSACGSPLKSQPVF